MIPSIRTTAVVVLTASAALFVGTVASANVNVNPMQIKPTAFPWKSISRDTILRRGLFSGPQNTQQNQLVRQLQTTSGNCTMDPFLWSIHREAANSSNGDQLVGYGVGTMHLPWHVVMTNEAWDTIDAAIQSSCAVYGEINFEDPQLEAELVACVADIEKDSATLADIPDDALRNIMANKLVEISQDIAPGNPDVQDVLYQAFQTLTMLSLIQIIQHFNTPEYWPSFRQTLVTGEVVPAMDASILAKGRPAGGLEDVDLQCQLVAAFNPSKDDFIHNYTDVWGPQLEAWVNESSSQLIQSYHCGDLSPFEDPALFDEGISEETETELLDDRNIDMAEQMVEILDSSTTRSVFAVGLAHWMLGENSLENLLGAKGYRLERVKVGSLDGLEALSNSDCGESTANGTGTETEAAVEKQAEEADDSPSESPPQPISSVSRQWVWSKLLAAAPVAVAMSLLFG